MLSDSDSRGAVQLELDLAWASDIYLDQSEIVEVFVILLVANGEVQLLLDHDEVEFKFVHLDAVNLSGPDINGVNRKQHLYDTHSEFSIRSNVLQGRDFINTSNLTWIRAKMKVKVCRAHFTILSVNLSDDSLSSWRRKMETSWDFCISFVAIFMACAEFILVTPVMIGVSDLYILNGTIVNSG